MQKNQRLHIMHFASGDLWAGAEVMLYTLVKAQLKIDKIEVGVILLNYGKLESELRQLGVEVIILDEERLNSIKIFWQLLCLLHRLKPDVLHTHRVKENIIGSIVAKINNIVSIRTVHGAIEHAYTWLQPHKKGIYFIDQFCARYLQSKIIAVSDDLAKILSKDIPKGKIDTIENGIDAELLSSLPNRQMQSCQDNSIKIGIVGRLTRVKRVDIFIRIAHHLLSHVPELNAKFHIYGDGPLRTELESLSHQLNLQHVIKFEGHRDSIHSDLYTLDLLLMTSDHEGLPMVLLEAMSLKTVIIAHAVGGIPKLLAEGECGILVQQQDIEQYSLEIQQILTNHERRRKLIESAHRRVNMQYSALQNAQSYNDTYIEVIQL